MERTLNSWAARIIIPSALTVVLFTVAVFLITIPAIESSLVVRKREMSRTLTESAWHTLSYFHSLEEKGVLSREDAQQHAIDQIRSMRYGPKKKDYFWINDMSPVMIMHPYLPELDGTNLSDWKDPNGKRLFIEFVQVVEAQGEGYVDYMWQWKDDPDIIAKKVSFVKGFEPWGWVIGTGNYIDDVGREIAALTGRLAVICLTILVLVTGLLMYTILQSLRGERLRKLAEDALRRNLKHLAAVINTTSEGFWIIGADGMIEDVNRSLTDMLGFPKEDMVGTDPQAYIVETKDQRASASRSVSPFALNRTTELKMRRSDGSLLNVLLHGSSLAEESSHKQVVFAFLTDITALKETEQKLRESEDRYRRLVETAPVSIVIHRQGRIEFANKAAIETFGFSQFAEMEGRHIEEFLQEDSRELAFQRINMIMANGVSLPPVALTLNKLDGEFVYADVTSAPVSYRGRIAVMTVILDRSERHKYEMELSRLFTAIEQAEEIFVITDEDFGVLYVNRAIEGLTGYAPEYFNTRTISDIFQTSEPDTVLAELQATISKSEVWRDQLEGHNRHGSPIRIEATVSPIRSTGNVLNYVAVIRDVTRETALERKLRQAQKLEAIGTLAGGIAHDFNNILYAIIGYSDMAQEELDGDGFASECVQEIITAASRAAELVKQILSFARQADHRKANIEVVPIVKEVLKLIRSTLPSNIEITQNLQDSRAIVVADPTEVHQVIMNLCTNAAQAMLLTGGTLDIGFREVEVDQAFTEAHPQLSPGPYALISISDTGPGIPEDIMDRIFEPFFTTKDTGEGTGMGLSVVHGIVTALGGMINVYNEPNRGATFNIYLPAVPGRVVAPRQDPTGPLHGTEHVLIVDDEEIITSMLRQMLVKLGYRVTAFTSSEKALEAFLAAPSSFDVVITDQTMPKITGDVFARKILEVEPQLPVILATGYSQAITNERAKEIGIAAFLSKPIFKADLARTLRRVLEGETG